MKKIILLVAFAFIGCSAPDQEENVTGKDCSCDRVIIVNAFSGSGGQHGVYTTLNDCTKAEKTAEFKGTTPVVGQCK